MAEGQKLASDRFDSLNFVLHLIFTTLKFLDPDRESVQSVLKLTSLFLIHSSYRLFWVAKVPLDVALGAKSFLAVLRFTKVLLFIAVFLTDQVFLQ